MTEITRYRNRAHTEILQEIYQQSLAIFNEGTFQELFKQLDESEKSNLQIVINHFEKGKGVLAVLITSLVHKLHNPNQDIRLHQDNMNGGYSGRGVDAKYITPFMKAQGFPAMAESGWLTRSLEQNLPYDLRYPGKIKPPNLKRSFLELLDLVQNQNRSPEKYLLVLFMKLIEYGIYPSLKYYLRFLHNTDNFVDNYVENLKRDKTIKYEHKLKWDQLVSNSG